jgi:hypothetical protein
VSGGTAEAVRPDVLRERVESFLEKIERAHYQALAGLADSPGLSAIYEEYRSLFTPSSFEAVEPPQGGTPDDRRRACLREFLAMGIEGHRNREGQDAYLTAEATAVAQVDGEAIPYRELPVRMRREPDRRARAGFETARLGIVAERLNPILQDSILTSHAVAEELLGMTYDRACENLSGVDFDALEARTSALLEETRDLHEDLLRYYVRRALPGVRRDELKTHDLSRMLYGGEFVSQFPAGPMVERIAGMTAAMGLDLTAGGRIELDLEDRPTKTPRAFCSAIRVPEEVKLVLRPYGGYDDYATFLHELGHALHFANVDPGQPMEFRLLGDNGVTEGFAIGFDHIVQLPEFLHRVMGMDHRDEFLRFIAFRELVMLRRYCAKFAYERSLHRLGPSPERAAEYAERLTEATGAQAPASLYLDDVDPHFYCIRYLRAWMLAGTLHQVMRDRFDADWFRNPDAGPFLQDLWSIGQAEPAEMLARERLGVEELNFDPLLEMVGGHLA